MASQIAPPTLHNFMDVGLGFPIAPKRRAREEEGCGSVISTAAEGSASSGIVGGASGGGGHHRTFKGVVLQHNGHWGAQIYANHQRIWLGTFRSEQAAAMAYDSAAAKLFSGAGAGAHHHHRNFPATEATGYELAFQGGLSTEDVLAMIKDGSYAPKLHDFVRAAYRPPGPDAVAPQREADGGAVGPVEGCDVTEMFRKELTPSDVGKLNRLVVPKKHALRYLPKVSATESEEVMVEYRDREARAWAFRYCYWKSSQSYVFTKGWNRFVREKGLRAKDVVAFSWCAEREGLRRSYAMIDVVRSDGGDGDGAVEDEDEEEVEVVSPAVAGFEGEERKKLRLFGAWIG